MGDSSPDRPNEVRMKAGRIEVEAKGYADADDLLDDASEHMDDLLKNWVRAEMEVVSEENDPFLRLGDR